MSDGDARVETTQLRPAQAMVDNEKLSDEVAALAKALGDILRYTREKEIRQRQPVTRRTWG